MNTRLPYKKQTPANREILRREAVEAYAGGESPIKIAKRLRVARATVYNWINSHKEDPEHGLEEQKRGPVSKLSPPQRQRLFELMEQGALAAGYETDNWTLPRIRDLIEERFGVSFDSSYLCRLLKSEGFSHQKFRTQAYERDEEAIDNWKRKVFPDAEKKG